MLSRVLTRTSQGIHLLEDGVLIGLVLYLLGISAIQIVLRNLGISSILWADPSIRITVLWLAFFGAMRASREQSHIAIDILTHYGNKTFRRTTHFFSSIFCAIVCAIAAWYSTLFIKEEMAGGMTAFADIPAWLCEIIIPFALGVIALRFFFNSLNLPEKSDDYT